MKSKLALLIGCGAIAGCAAFAAVSLAGVGGDSARSGSYTVAKAQTGVPHGATTADARQKKSSRPTIQYYYATKPTVPDEGQGVVTPLRCPQHKGQPIGGGAQTQNGIVISYLSRVNPQTGRTRSRTYYVGIADNSSDADQAGHGAVVEIQCARNIAVKTG